MSDTSQVGFNRSPGIALVTTAALSTFAMAQARTVGATRWSVVPPEGEALQVAPRKFRVFGVPAAIRLSLTVANDSPVAWETDYGRLRRRFRFESDTKIPLTVAWPDDKPSAIRLAARTAVSYAIEVRRADQRPFSAGTYVMTPIADQAFDELRGNRVLVLVPVVRGQPMSFHVGPPLNGRQQSTMLRLQSKAAGDRNPAEAIRLLRLATEADPTDMASLLDLAQAYVAAKRYRDSVPLFERALAGQATWHHSSIPYSLAFVHVALGNDAEARRVLRAAGVSDEGIATSIERFHRTISSR